LQKTSNYIPEDISLETRLQSARKTLTGETEAFPSQLVQFCAQFKHGGGTESTLLSQDRVNTFSYTERRGVTFMFILSSLVGPISSDSSKNFCKII
jgi:hypothetical protein